MNPSEMADYLVSFTREDWLKVIGSLEETFTDRVNALLEPNNCEAEKGVGAAVDELMRLGEEINRRMADSEKYRRVPEPLRSFFETQGHAAIAAGLRLLESANARIQVEEIERKLREVSLSDECEGCDLKEALESIEKVLSSSYLDLAP